MSLSDCIKCWDTQCSCGYEYLNMSINDRMRRAALILQVEEEWLYNLMSIHNMVGTKPYSDDEQIEGTAENWENGKLGMSEEHVVVSDLSLDDLGIEKRPPHNVPSPPDREVSGTIPPKKEVEDE